MSIAKYVQEQKKKKKIKKEILKINLNKRIDKNSNIKNRKNLTFQ